MFTFGLILRTLIVNVTALLLFSHENDADRLSSVNRTDPIEAVALVRSESAATRTALSMVDWQVKLSNLLLSSSNHKIVFIGVGHPLRGDDYVGSYVVKELIKRVECNSIKVDFLDAEDSVESVITKAHQARPKHIIFIDSCEMNVQPGEIHLISVSETDYPFFTTHGIPLKLLSERLLPQSEAWVLAIQPKQVEFSEKMSQEVSEAGISVSQFILEKLSEGD